LPQGKPNTSILYIAAMVCLLAVGLFMFSKSDFFSVGNIEIIGLNNVSEDEVLKLVGTAKGENLFLTDKTALAQKIKLHPLVDDVKVEKELPATLVFNIQERLPVALIHNKDGMVEVDSQGIILRFYEMWPTNDNPVITGVEVPETIGPGQKIVSPQLAKGLQIIGQASDELKGLMGEVHLAADGQAFLYLTSGTEVKFGYGEEYQGKIKLLDELLKSPEYKTVEKAIKYIDLTAGKPVLGR